MTILLKFFMEPKMKKVYPKLIIASLVLACGLEYALHHSFKKLEQEAKVNNDLKAQVKSEENKLKEKQELIDFTYKAMDIPPVTKLSQARKEIIANKLATLTTQYITGQDSREQYISMIKLESNFNNNVKSSAGAIGVAQVMKPTFKTVASDDDCEIDVNDDDIYNEDINLEVGVCYYAQLLVLNNQNSRLATLWYNGGPFTVEKFKKLGDVNQESSNYALKTEYVKELANK